MQFYQNQSPFKLRLTNGADEIVVLAHEVGNAHAHKDGGDAAADEALPGLLGAELDERGAAEEEAEHVGHHVVQYDHHDRDDEPNQALKHVLERKI